MKVKRREISHCAGRPFTEVKGKKKSACCEMTVVGWRTLRAMLPF